MSEDGAGRGDGDEGVVAFWIGRGCEHWIDG